MKRENTKQFTTYMTRCIRFLITGLILAISALSLNAQGWKRAYTEATTIYRTAQTPDGGFLASAINDDKNLTILKTDADGLLLKTTVLRSINKVSLGYITKANDGNFFVVFSDSSAFSSILKITPYGDSIWLKRVPVNINFYDVQSLTDGGLGILGTAAGQLPLLIKVNPQGDTVWTRKYVNSSDRLSGFVENNDGSITWQINEASKAVLWKLAANGSPLTTTAINSSNNSFIRFVKMSDGIYGICTGSQIFKVKSDGRFVWGNIPIFGVSGKSIFSITPTSDGGLVALGYGNNAVLGETEILKLDSTGRQIWTLKVSEDIEIEQGKEYLTYLSSTVQESKDKGFILSGNVIKSPFNTASLKSGHLIKTNGEGKVYGYAISGKVAADLNGNCKIDNAEKPVSGWVIKAEGGANRIFNTTTDAQGNYNFALDSGQYKLTVFAPNNLWKPCFTDSVLSLNAAAPIKFFDIPVKSNLQCGGLRVSIGTPLLRRCFNNTYRVSYCNEGTISVQDAYVEVTLDSNLVFQSSTLSVASKNKNVYRFNVGNLDVFQCRSFNIVVNVNCGTPSVLGRALCAEARISPVSLCPPYTGAIMELTGTCTRDSVTFFLRNKSTTSPTSGTIKHVVVEDQVVFLRGNNPYNAEQGRTFSFPAKGKTYRFEATQDGGYPFNQLLAVTIEGCGTNAQGGISTGYLTQLPEADGDPFIDIDCQQVISSLESNTKIASPSGYETEHQIEQLTNLDYMIRFRNIGNDTAFNVIVKDTLSNFLEPTSIEFGASSHPYMVEWQENNIVKFIFKNILLTDSITNGAASLGFLKFRVSQKPNLPSGTKIFNKAALYFDFNAPQSTSQTFHTVGKNFMVTASTDLTLPNGRNIKVYPNPFTEQAVFDIEGDPLSIRSTFRLYDMMGRLLRSEQFDTNQYPFLRKDLTGGMYLFTIENDKKIIGRGKLMVQ
jgi:hypothetical protein